MTNDPIERVDQLSTRSPRELALLVAEHEKELKRVYEKLQEGTLHVGHCNALHSDPVGVGICSCPLGRKIKNAEHRAEAAEQHSAQLRSALAELVRLKELSDNCVTKFRDSRYTAAIEEWNRCSPLAWAAARKALEP